jgi:uncharacterized protein YkwD
MADIDTAMLCRFAARGAIVGRRFVVGSLSALGLAAALATPAASAHGGACALAHTRISTASRPVMQAAVVCLINRQRTGHHLPALHENARLNRSAQGWTNVLVRNRAFSHAGNFSARISAVGFNWSLVGENIAAGFDTPASVVRAWMASPGHCRNILSPSFLDVGTGVSQRSVAGAGGPGTWTQDFGLPMGAHAPSGNSGPANGCPY